MSIIMDDFFWKTQYTVIMFFIDTILILLLIFSRKKLELMNDINKML